MIKVLAVVTAVNIWHSYTKQAIETLFNQNLEGIELKVLLVDNGSTDPTEVESNKLASEREDFIVTKYNDNVGVQRAWNNAIDLGFKEGYDYILIANNDVLFHKNAIKVLAERLDKKDETTVLVSSLDLRMECGVPTEIFDKGDNDKQGLEESPHPNFSSFMINRKLIEKVGYFDEGFFPAYYEDNDMHYRIQKAGLVALCCPMSMFYHFASKTQTQDGHPGGFTKPEQFAGSKAYFVKKWGGFPGKEIYNKPFNDENKTIKYTKQGE